MLSRLALICVLLTVPVGAATAPISVAVSPSFSFERVPVWVTIRIPRHTDNREFCVNILDMEDEEVISISCRELKGETAPALFQVEYRRVSFGTYAVFGELIQATGGTPRSPLVPFQILESIPTP